MFNKRALTWGIDLILGVSIFIVGIVAFYSFTYNLGSNVDNVFKELSIESEIIIDSLLSEGFPENWNTTNVIVIGLLSNGKINMTKLEGFYNLTVDDYNRTKRIFNTRYDFYFALDEDMTFNGNNVEGFGLEGVDIENINAEDIIIKRRLVIYDNRPAQAFFYLWR